MNIDVSKFLNSDQKNEQDFSVMSPHCFLEAAKEYPVIDVRTPAEFAQGHIPGAVNMPLFSNEERAVVGTLYKQETKRAAVLKGLEFVGPKMAGFATKALSLAVDNRVLVHCWRGGMRSGSMAWLFRTTGLQAATLDGGYKAYRASFRKMLKEKAWRFIVIGGPTGSGKTEVLYELEKQGAQVLDLEGLANHKGSAFGALGQKAQPSTEQFENDIHQQFRNFDSQKIVWVEGESRSIGRVFIPDDLFPLLMDASLVMYDLDRRLRIERLVHDYGCFDHSVLAEAILRIQKRLGGLRVKEALEALEVSDYHKVADITLDYYDKGYAKSLGRRQKPVLTLREGIDNPAKVAGYLLKEFE